MYKQLLLACLLGLATYKASADTLKLYDEDGVSTTINTDTFTGCVRLFDSQHQPFEICRLAPVVSITRVVVPTQSVVGLGSARQQNRATARRVYRRMGRRD